MRPHRSRLLALATVGALAALQHGCGAGSSSSSGSLTTDIGKDLSGYVIVDLTSGSLTTADALPDLLTNPAYRTTAMVFRAVPAGTMTLGQASGTFGADPSEAPTTVTLPRYLIGVFDITQAQWQEMAGSGSAPWNDPAELAVTGNAAVAPEKPAFGLSRDAVLAAIQAVQARFAFPASLPTGAQWEYACRAGVTTVFPWGDLGATPAATALPYALVEETSGGALGPAIVGSYQPNGFGLYDMVGNVWQWTSDGSGIIRGGSWRDSLALARCATAVPLNHAIGHVLVGARLVLSP